MRASLRVRTPGGRREVIGFLTSLSADQVGIVDRRGTEHLLATADVDAVRPVAVALGRRPESTPRDLLDALATRAGVRGACWVGRISTLLADRTPPASVPAWGEWAEFGGVRARFEGEWVTLPLAPVETIVEAAWWATRMGARSVQIRAEEADDPTTDDLTAAGFTRLG
ncbi:MAG: hypothetical protein QM708_05090 [Propioniciclava sp.]|uniref:hypothetical protein n=1 Tax=Propioniciclava sp. TaxID=2038686 RepID=UPI0039E41696